MDLDKELAKVDAQILALQKRIDQETQFLEKHTSIRRNFVNALAQVKAKKDSLEAKELMAFCDTSGISKSDLWDAARKLKEQKDKESDLMAQSQTAEKQTESEVRETASVQNNNEQAIEGKGKTVSSNNRSSDVNHSPVAPKEKGKPLTPLDKAKMEQQKRIAQEQTKSPPKPQPAQKNSLEERLGPYMGR